MGAKAPEKLKLRRQSCKCHDCGRKFLNVQALSSHRKFMHKSKNVVTKRDTRKPTDTQDAKVVKKVVSPPDSNAPAQVPTPKPKANPNKNSSKMIIEESSAKKTTVPKKIEFKCPRCVKVFSVYFSANRHIQKYHCVDENNKPVKPDSPDIVKPIRVELCESCNKYSNASETHSCETVKQDRSMCLGCQKTFESITLFDQHIKGAHTHRAECLFFTNHDDYAAWKTELESITKVKFVSLETSDPKSKHIHYHCSHQSLIIKPDKILRCPSIISVTELSNGYRVLYYKEHFGHSCIDLAPLDYKKYSILPFLKDIEIQNIDSDEHVHQQLKSIVNNVTANAAKADISVLYSLLEKALDMTAVLNSIGQADQNVVNNSMTDEQITEVLSEVKILPAKRKSETVKKDVKQTKPEVDNNENLKTNTVANKTVAKKVVESLPSTPLKPIVQSSPSSFNDSYKDFVESNFKPGMDGSTTKKNVIKKKAVVKTKIGQFKARPSLSPKIDQEIQTSSPDNDIPEPSPKRLRPTLSPKTPIPKPNVRPVPSPKTVKTTPKLVESKKRPDFEYEVREQENDCNILILKF